MISTYFSSDSVSKHGHILRYCKLGLQYRRVFFNIEILRGNNFAHDEKCLREMCDTIQHSNLCIMEVPGEVKEKGEEKKLRK